MGNFLPWGGLGKGLLHEHLVEACALDAAKQIKTLLGDSYLLVEMDEERSDLALLGQSCRYYYLYIKEVVSSYV